ncbi:MAG TPA: hypothetical protein VIJ14_06415, partial [Rhabdochlamydiaceae bacterium]
VSVYYPPIYHDDTSPVYFDFMKTPPAPILDKLFNELKKDFNNSTWLVKNANVVFKCASTQLHRMTVVCIIAAILTTIGGLGAALCKREYKKTRFAFVCLTVISAALSVFSALTLFHMHAKVSHYSGFFERRWS